MSEYRLDRTAFKAQTAKETDNHESFYHQLPDKESKGVVNYLNSIAYNYPENSPPRMDRTAFSVRSRNK